VDTGVAGGTIGVSGVGCPRLFVVTVVLGLMGAENVVLSSLSRGGSICVPLA